MYTNVLNLHPVLKYTDSRSRSSVYDILFYREMQKNIVLAFELLWKYDTRLS